MDPVQDVDRRLRFERLAADVYEPVQRYLLRRTEPATADDVLGDVLLVLWRRLYAVPSDVPAGHAGGLRRHGDRGRR